MIWVGGGIVMHGLEDYGLGGLAHLVHDVAVAAGRAVAPAAGLVEWLVSAVGSGILGLLIGAVLIPLVQHVAVPVWRSVRTGRTG